MFPTLRFNAVPVAAGFDLKTDDGVTVGYVTAVEKQMLRKWYVTQVATQTKLVGEEMV